MGDGRMRVRMQKFGEPVEPVARGADPGGPAATGGIAGLHVAVTTDRARIAGHPMLAPLAVESCRAQHVDIAPVERIVGTTGAGDTATAGFLVALLGAVSAATAGERAAALAARHISGRPLI